MRTGLPDPSQNNISIVFVPRTILSQTLHCASLYILQQENLPLTPQNGCHLAPSLPHCFIQCHWYSMSGMLPLHLYPFTVPLEITLILSKYESNLPPSVSAHHLSPEGKPPHLQGPQPLTGAGSHHLSTLVCLFYLLMVRTSQARPCPRFFFFQTPLHSSHFLYLWSCKFLLGIDPWRHLYLLLFGTLLPPGLFLFRSYSN